MDQQPHILDRLYQVILSRKSAATDNSYTATLLTGSIDKVLKKVGEEATEVVIAGKGGTERELVCETADLLYHTLVLLAARGMDIADVWGELEKRSGISGLAEKAARPVS